LLLLLLLLLRFSAALPLVTRLFPLSLWALAPHWVHSSRCTCTPAPPTSRRAVAVVLCVLHQKLFLSVSLWRAGGEQFRGCCIAVFTSPVMVSGSCTALLPWMNRKGPRANGCWTMRRRAR